MLTANQGYEILQDVKAVNADRERWHSRMSLEKALESRDVPVPNSDTKANGRRNAPSGESQSLSHEFLQQMIGQKLALAKISHAIIDRAYGGDPDPDAIESTIRSSSEWQILPEEVKSMAQDCLELYRYNHQQVENYRATYPNDRQLYRGIFHRRPKGKVKVVKGPITLNFICDNKEDYTYIVSQNWLDETPSEPTKEDKDYAIRTGGVHLQSFGGIINAENNALRYRIQPASLEYKQSIQIHENQHANYQLLTSSETSVGFIGPSINWYQELQQSDKNVQRQRIHGVLTQMRNRLIDTQVKDELLAYIADGYYDEGEILKILFESKSKGGLYDYASSISSSIEYELKRIEDNVPGISNNELLEISTDRKSTRLNSSHVK